MMSEELGKTLARLIAERGLKKKALAKAAGISESYLRLLLRGHRYDQTTPVKPSAEVCQSLAKVLGIPEGSLLELAGYSSTSIEGEAGSGALTAAELLDAVGAAGYSAPSSLPGQAETYAEAIQTGFLLVSHLSRNLPLSDRAKMTLSRILVRHALDLVEIAARDR